MGDQQVDGRRGRRRDRDSNEGPEQQGEAEPHRAATRSGSSTSLRRMNHGMKGAS